MTLPDLYSPEPVKHERSFRTLTIGEVRNGKTYTPFQVRLMDALNKEGIHHVSEYPIETDILQERFMRHGLPYHEGHTVFSIDIFIEPNICVEIDGLQHSTARHSKRDSRRDDWLVEHGYLVMRFANRRIQTDLVNVVEEIKFAVEGANP